MLLKYLHSAKSLIHPVKYVNTYIMVKCMTNADAHGMYLLTHSFLYSHCYLL